MAISIGRSPSSTALLPKVKAAILSTLSIIISKGRIALKPFLPQLQTTFIKCLQDNARIVRSSSALALGKLSALSTQVDPLVNDLLSTLQSLDGDIKEAVLTALKGVFKHAGKNVSGAIRLQASSLVRDMLQLDDDKVRSSAAKVMGIMSQYMEDNEFQNLLQVLVGLTKSANWFVRHGSFLTLSSISLHNPSTLYRSLLFPSFLDNLKVALKDDKFPIRETTTKTIGRLLCFRVGKEGNVCSHLVQLLILASQDESSEVRRRALSGIKAYAKVNPSAVAASLSILGPAIADNLKDMSGPVNLICEEGFNSGAPCAEKSIIDLINTVFLIAYTLCLLILCLRRQYSSGNRHREWTPSFTTRLVKTFATQRHPSLYLDDDPGKGFIRSHQHFPA